MSCGPKRIQLLSVSDHGSHCTLLLLQERWWWLMTDSLLISRIPRICQKSHHPWFAWIFDEKLLWAPPVSSNVSSHLPPPVSSNVSSRLPPPSTNLNYAADHFAQTQTGGNFKIRNIWFSYKTFLLPSRFFFAAIQKRERSLLVCSGNWKLVDRHKGAKELIWEEPIYGRNYIRLLFSFFFCPYIWLSIPNLCNGVFSIFVKAKQEISKNYILQ